ncbi:MAG: anaerobic ribonucleoside-triphosphate reductase activating protein [Clostridia bacterium]|nr:anaerobic ribonucleoside-triphosphate reductase activating protein [Clostridia bacterium]
MKIAGLGKNSVVDYPRKIAAVVFTLGCNLDCYYCHNRILIEEGIKQDIIPLDDIFCFLEKRQGILDGVVISGGEPTLQSGLEDFICKVKELGYSVKLDTNGSNPEILEDLMKKGLIDYVAMDLKAPFRKYKDICGNDKFINSIKESTKILFSGKVDYEFRTTFVPELTGEDILEIVNVIKDAQLYVLQQYRIPIVPNDSKKANRLLQKPHSSKFIMDTIRKIKNDGTVKNCIARGL